MRAQHNENKPQSHPAPFNPLRNNQPRNPTRYFYICTDATGTTCELIGTDSFAVVKTENKYISDPKYFEVNLAAVKDKYPKCKKWHS